MSVFCEPKNIDIEYTGKRRTKYLAIIPVDHDVEDVLSPDYFGRVMASNMLTVGDLIEFQAADFSFYGELMVRAQLTSSQQLLTHLRGEVTHFEEHDLPDGWDITWLGGKDFFAIRVNDQQVEAGFQTKDAAAVRIHAIVAKDKAAQLSRQAVKKALPKSTKSKTVAKTQAVKEPA